MDSETISAVLRVCLYFLNSLFPKSCGNENGCEDSTFDVTDFQLLNNILCGKR